MLAWLLIQNIQNTIIIPAAMSAIDPAIATIAYSLVRGFAHSCLLLFICSVAIRLIWQSAIIVHGLGHTIAIAISDRELSAINLTNILEHQAVADILKSLLPFHHIFIPIVSPRLPPSPSPLVSSSQQENPIT